MLRMSKLADYGTLVMSTMARSPADLFKARELADATSVALPTVSKILKLLSRGELVVSHQGSHGGYRLAREPRAISIADIVQVIDGGPIALTECSGEDSSCEQEATCSIRGNWQRISQVVREALEGVSLAEIAESSPPTVSLNELQRNVVN